MLEEVSSDRYFYRCLNPMEKRYHRGFVNQVQSLQTDWTGGYDSVATSWIAGASTPDEYL